MHEFRLLNGFECENKSAAFRLAFDFAMVDFAHCSRRRGRNRQWKMQSNQTSSTNFTIAIAVVTTQNVGCPNRIINSTLNIILSAIWWVHFGNRFSTHELHWKRSALAILQNNRIRNAAIVRSALAFIYVSARRIVTAFPYNTIDLSRVRETRSWGDGRGGCEGKRVWRMAVEMVEASRIQHRRSEYTTCGLTWVVEGGQSGGRGVMRGRGRTVSMPDGKQHYGEYSNFVNGLRWN